MTGNVIITRADEARQILQLEGAAKVAL